MEFFVLSHVVLIVMLQISLHSVHAETPDSVSIRSVNHTSPMVEGSQYQLECEVRSVAPVQKLIVKLFRGEITLNESVSTKTFRGNEKENVTVTDRLQITAHREDHGAQYKCVAELELDSNQTVPESVSEPLNITILYKPLITNLTNHTVTVTVGDKLELDCSADGNPAPTYMWWHNNMQMEKDDVSILRIEKVQPEHQGRYSCTASNEQGGDARTVAVQIIDDYLPIIAGLAAVAMVILLVVGFVVYSGHHKKNRTGHYKLKDAPTRGQNRHVAHDQSHL